MLRKYPIGLQSFREIREGNYVYIDKTEAIHTLVETGKYYFLSRPRRFGKSLLVDTIEELFNGSKELFEGLWIYDKWDWSKTNPVIHFSFASIGINTKGLEAAINGALDDNASRLGVSLISKEYDLRFKELIQKASSKGAVVILIDEYDKPIIDFLEKPEEVEAHRAKMRNFYSILKDSDKYIRLLLITGVSQFSKVSIFSDLNNLDNISLMPPFGDIVGITQSELEVNFASEITKMQKNNPDLLAQIKDWYNGYTWNMETWVYNPFSLLKFMRYRLFRNYWFETATPTFLYKLLQKKTLYDIENYTIGSSELVTFNTTNPQIAQLLFQTGYLTIKNIFEGGELYELGFPNREVKASLLGGLLSAYQDNDGQSSMDLLVGLRRSLVNGDIPELILRLNAIIAGVPYDLWKPDTEKIFHALLHIGFKFAGLDVESELHSSKGRCDIIVKTDLFIYAMELKLDGSAAVALSQIKAKGYLNPYGADPRKKMAVGISFSSQNRAVTEYLVEEA